MTGSSTETNASELARGLDAALAEVAAAEEALDALLGDLRAGVRAEKVSITAGVEAAFARLRNSRVALAKVREQIEHLSSR